MRTVVEPVYEVELKFPLPDPTSWERLMASRGVVWGDAVIERDLFFEHPSRDFVQTDEALRIRTTSFSESFSGERTTRTLTYKGAKVNDISKSRREIEIALSDGAWNELFTVLGFMPVAEVVKRRRTASLTHAGRVWTLTRDTLLECEACCECREWCELEILATSDELADTSRALESFAATLELTNGTRRSYLEMVS